MTANGIWITRDDLSGRLSRLALAARRPEPVLRAMGRELLDITRGNFTGAGAGFRPLPWPNKKDGTPATLVKSGALAQSFQLSVSASAVSVGNSSIYAATHQYGRPQGRGEIPARPFFPMLHGRLTPAAQASVAAAGRQALAGQL